MSITMETNVNLRQIAEEEVKKAVKKLLNEEYQRGYQDGYNQAKRETPIIINNPVPQIVPQPYYPYGWPTITWDSTPVVTCDSTGKGTTSTTTTTKTSKDAPDAYTFTPYVKSNPNVTSAYTTTSTGTTGNYTISAYNTNGPTITVNKIEPQTAQAGINQLLTDSYDLIQELIKKAKDKGDIK